MPFWKWTQVVALDNKRPSCSGHPAHMCPQPYIIYTYLQRWHIYLWLRSLHLHIYPYNHRVKSHGNEIQWSHTKLSGSLKPEWQEPHEGLLYTPSLQAWLPASPYLCYFAEQLRFTSSRGADRQTDRQAGWLGWVTMSVNFCRKGLQCVQTDLVQKWLVTTSFSSIQKASSWAPF